MKLEGITLVFLYKDYLISWNNKLYQGKYKKKLLWIDGYKPKCKLGEIFIIKQSELKYLINFRKINQTRFYD